MAQEPESIPEVDEEVAVTIPKLEAYTGFQDAAPLWLFMQNGARE
jgi:hypothetical protein